MKATAPLVEETSRRTGQQHSRFRYAGILLTACFMLCLQPFLQSCTEVDSRFSNIYVRFIMDNVLQSPAVLYPSCNSMGEFCTITAKGQQFIFENTRQKESVNFTAMNNYQGFSFGLSTGLIVGLPTIPEMGAMQSQVVCFDLACANCYQDYSICKRMQLKENGKAHCKSCQRTYDLNNQGLVCDGVSGRPLYRYRVSLNGNSLIVSNR